MNQEVLMGNTLEETAYHEAGHIVIAAALGLGLRSRGIVVWAAAEDDITDGLACYWDDVAEPEVALIAIRAGVLSQLRAYPSSNTWGAQPDIHVFFSIVNACFEQGRAGDMWEKATLQASTLLDVHWSAVIAG